MGPETLNLTAYTDTGLYEVMQVVSRSARTPQNLTGWLVHASAVEGLMDVAEAVAITASVVDAAQGTISVSISAAVAAALFPSGDASMMKTFDWTFLAKPYGTYVVKLFVGRLTVVRGAGRWA